jgi:hypothetical protein
MGGIKVTCESCHPNEAANNKHNSVPECIDCHMGRATKSARKVNDHQGDLRTHIFKIKPDTLFASDPGGMFYQDGTVTLSNGYVTLDFACYGCHKNPDNGDVGGPNSSKDLVEISGRRRRRSTRHSRRAIFLTDRFPFETPPSL